jgi:hypothetical protein
MPDYRIMTRDALDKAFDDHVSKLFDVLCSGFIAGDAKQAIERFMTGYRATMSAHQAITERTAES